MELKISNLPSEVVKKLKLGERIEIILFGEVCGIEFENLFSAPIFISGTETTIFFEEQDIEVKEKESIEIPETYAECQDYYNRSLKTCSGCALEFQHGCGRIRENIMKFYQARI